MNIIFIYVLICVSIVTGKQVLLKRNPCKKKKYYLGSDFQSIIILHDKNPYLSVFIKT